MVPSFERGEIVLRLGSELRSGRTVVSGTRMGSVIGIYLHRSRDNRPSRCSSVKTTF